MATRTVTVGERKAQLEAEIAQSMAAQRRAESELVNFENSLAATAIDLATLDLKHIDACRAEALGQKSNRALVEADISAIGARRKGLEKLIAEQAERIQQIREARGPQEVEFAAIHRQETVDRQVAEIEASLAAGETEVKQHHEITASIHQRLALLRSYEDTAVRKLAFDAAERLGRLWQGLRP